MASAAPQQTNRLATIRAQFKVTPLIILPAVPTSPIANQSVDRPQSRGAEAVMMSSAVMMSPAGMMSLFLPRHQQLV